MVQNSVVLKKMPINTVYSISLEVVTKLWPRSVYPEKHCMGYRKFLHGTKTQNQANPRDRTN